MPLTHIAQRRSAKRLPPAAPLPASLQTLACRLWPLSYFERCHARYGERFTVQPIAMPPLVLLANPHEVRAVLTAPESELDTSAGGEVVAPLFGEHSFMLHDGDEHMRGRNAILPAFHRRAVVTYADLVNSLAAEEIRSWPANEPFATYPRLRALTLQVLVRSLFGNGNPALEQLQKQLLKMLTVMAGLMLQEPLLRHLPGWHVSWRRFLRRRAEAHRLIDSLLAHRRRSEAGGDDLLDMLIAAHNPDGSPLSNQQVRDNLISVLIAGHETTASQLAWAFQLLAHNPAVQTRLIEELDAGAEEYLAATVHEVLRHRPVFLFAGPRAVVDTVEVGGWTYRAPTRLLPCIYLVHHHPDLYPQPWEFRPERFLGTAPRPRIWLPWGGGRKRCIGQHLALLEMRAVLRAVLSTRQVHPASRRIERARWRTVLVTPHAGSQIVLRRRSPAGASANATSRPADDGPTAGRCMRPFVPIGTDPFQLERISSDSSRKKA